MTWLVWREHRVQILAMLVGAGLIAAALAWGADLAVRTRAELDTCGPTTDCVYLAGQVGERLLPFRMLVITLFFIPAVVASFVGGPMFARDLERGTHRFVWTQAVSRLRWTTVTLFAILGTGLAAAILVARFGGLSRVINGSQSNAFQAFDLEGPAFVSYVIFGIAAGAFFGAWSRRILGGMFTALLVFGVMRLGVTHELRPQYEPPVTVLYTTAPLVQERVPADAWIIRVDFVDPAGRPVAQERYDKLQREFRPTAGNVDRSAYLAQNGVINRIRYQPAERYWPFQLIESGIYLTLAAAFVAGTLLLLKRRDA